MSLTTRQYGECPECHTQCWDDAIGEESNLVEVKNRRATNTDYGPGEDWTEVWKCPKCGRKFEETNGYP